MEAVTPDGRPPVQPFLRCAEDATARTAEWFAEHDPATRTPVEIDVSSGRDPSIPAVAERLVDHLGRLEQEVFAYESHEATGRAAAADHGRTSPSGFVR